MAVPLSVLPPGCYTPRFLALGLFVPLDSGAATDDGGLEIKGCRVQVIVGSFASYNDNGYSVAAWKFCRLKPAQPFWVLIETSIAGNYQDLYDWSQFDCAGNFPGPLHTIYKFNILPECPTIDRCMKYGYPKDGIQYKCEDLSGPCEGSPPDLRPAWCP